jgi:hypothetical protein
VWESRGSGFYGFVAAGTFLYLEATDLVGDVPALLAVGLDLGELISFFVNNLVEAVMFTVTAALWPVWWIEHVGINLGSAVLLGVGYLAYRAVRPTVTRWLEDPESDTERPPAA